MAIVGVGAMVVMMTISTASGESGGIKRMNFKFICMSRIFALFMIIVAVYVSLIRFHIVRQFFWHT